MSGGWYASDSARWPGRLERLRRLGPLDEDDARDDLRYLESEHRLWMRSEGRSGQRFPGRDTLAKRWGWGDRRTRALIAANDWHDPEQPVAMEDLRPLRSARVKVQVAPESRPGQQRTNAENSTDAAQVAPESRPGQRPHARTTIAPITDPPITENNARARATPTHQKDPAVLAVWATCLECWPPLGERPTKPEAERLHARIAEHGAPDVEGVARYVYRGPDPWRREHTPSPASWARPEAYAQLAPKARRWARATAQAPPDGGGKPPELTPEERAALDAFDRQHGLGQYAPPTHKTTTSEART